MNGITIKSLEWNDYLEGYIGELVDGREFGVQSTQETNPLHGGFGEWYPTLVSIEDPNFEPDFTIDELEMLKEMLSKNPIIAKECEMLHREEDYY